jgi:hypothetical protein
MITINIQIANEQEFMDLRYNVMSLFQSEHIDLNITILSDLKIIIHNEKYAFSSKFNDIDYIIEMIEDDPVFLIRLFCKKNGMILIDMNEDIKSFSKRLFNYFFDVINQPELKEYYKLKYA